ncbi:zinc finger CCCH domain-containing protein 18-like isoform X2 [Andrographis paniculata]|nr:zinc finger CCCH domain-containing protein 18-like isoform X2 [Andrographis paniculata]XP_051140096.1 zinc finger CCCH domain-containing protein 18-like isoform X2 [Andrographis paniculata]
MDKSELSMMLFQRIQKLDPKHVSKIMGYLLLKDQSEVDMIHHAPAPDNVIQSLIENIKQELCVPPKPPVPAYVLTALNCPTKFSPSLPWFPASSAGFSHEIAQQVPQAPTGQQQQVTPLVNQLGCHKATGLNLNVQSYVPQAVKHHQASSLDMYPHSSDQLSAPICENYSKGYCEHCGDCKFLHLLKLQNGKFMIINQPKGVADNSTSSSDRYTLQLEEQFVEILKIRRGIPVPLSCLPILYHDKYCKSLPVQACMKEPHKLRKICCTLTELIRQMKSIKVTDKWHGMESTILEDDLSTYLKSMKKERGRGQALQATAKFM